MSDKSVDPARIERDLNQTRSRLGSHLSELQDRLSPGQVVDDLMGYFRGSEGAEFGRSLLDNVRGNPMPAALTGIGLAWLMASNPRAGAGHTSAVPASAGAGGGVRSTGPHVYGREDYGATLNRVQRAEIGVSREADEADHVYSARLDQARGQAIGLARHDEETTESFGSRIKDALSSAQQSIADTAQGLRGQAGSAVGSAGNALGSLTSSTRDAFQSAGQYAGGAVSQGGKAAGQAGGNLVAALTESPVLLGALGLAAGALLGALLPQSDQEEAALGGIAGQARDTATNLARQGMESGRNVAQAVAATARDSAQGHGLTGGRTTGQLIDSALSGELAGHAKEVLQDAMRSGGEAVRKEVGQTDASQPASSTS